MRMSLPASDVTSVIRKQKLKIVYIAADSINIAPTDVYVFKKAGVLDGSLPRLTMVLSVTYSELLFDLELGRENGLDFS